MENYNEKIRNEFESRRKTTGPAQHVEYQGSLTEINDNILSAADSLGAVISVTSEQNHATINAAKSIDKMHNPNDGRPC
jgi:ABC-type uncharacterized transport system auxiliary subunit